jgi:acetyltransferase-like isoleucine patch superfamily enzyme
VLIKRNRIPVGHIILIGLWPGFIKKAIYSLRGYRFGKGVKLAFGCVVIGKDVHIGDHSSIGFFTIVRADKIEIKRFVKIGSMSAIDTGKLLMDDDARINEQVYVGGIKTPASELRMGKRTIIMQASYINPTLPVIIGDDSGIGGSCLLFTHGSWNSELEGYPVKFAPVTLGKKVWLPWRVFIMPGVSIGDGAVVGANSLVNKDVAAGTLVAGNPAVLLKQNFPKPLSGDERENILDRIFTDFERHLNYHEFKVTRTAIDGGLAFHISNGRRRSLVVYLSAEVKLLPVSDVADSVLLLDHPGLHAATSTFTMNISLTENTRKGSSDTGEELLSFLSRYGIRFNRLD